ncbi:hypothetical protein [Photobacterium leiognathi]|uniref:hypothetical protein n=1 Tax=Photobacterium leiognathi TaxID=553611 RepID=UPI002738C357|nr:hypothetical protein [Photobacterium leiognathi]
MTNAVVKINMLPSGEPHIAMVESGVFSQDIAFIFDKEDKGKVIHGSILRSLDHFYSINQQSDYNVEVHLITDVLATTRKAISEAADGGQIDRQEYLDALQRIEDEFKTFNSLMAVLVIIDGGEDHVATFICEESDFDTALALHDLDKAVCSKEKIPMLH